MYAQLQEQLSSWCRYSLQLGQWCLRDPVLVLLSHLHRSHLDHELLCSDQVHLPGCVDYSHARQLGMYGDTVLLQRHDSPVSHTISITGDAL